MLFQAQNRTTEQLQLWQYLIIKYIQQQSYQPLNADNSSFETNNEYLENYVNQTYKVLKQ